jgi:hypothetical protein
MGIASTLARDIDPKRSVLPETLLLESSAYTNAMSVVAFVLPPVMKVMIDEWVRPVTGVQTRYDLPNGDEDVVSFEGELIAHVSSKEPYGDRSRFWREVAIFRNAAGGYVVQSIGATSVPGKKIRNTVSCLPNAAAVYELLVPAGQRPRNLIADLLDDVARKDASFVSAVGDRLDVEDLEGPPGEGAIIELPRENDRWLRFTGVRIARESSRLGNAPSWTEIEIYRTGGPRYVVYKAQRIAGDVDPSHPNVRVVEDGRAALEAFIRPGVTWIESAALAALAEASDRDAHFAATLGDLLYDDKFRELLPEVPSLSATQRAILARLDRGARIVTERVDDKRSRVTGWLNAPEGTPIPIWQVFLKLSRQRLVMRVLPSAMTGRDEWQISDLGRAALKHGAAN